jgi:hypothetical protein
MDGVVSDLGTWGILIPEVPNYLSGVYLPAYYLLLGK